jgi:hypothetical protein
MNTLSIGKFRVSIFAAVVAVAAFSPALHGQDVGMIGKVNVPFAFETASGHRFDAGVYTIHMENTHTLLIKGVSDSGLAWTSIEDNAQSAEASKATFRKYGNQYFLSEITVAGKSRRLYFQPSKTENQLRIAGNKTAPTNVELSLATAR